MKIYVNGNLVEASKLAEIFEPGFLFGWGIFEPFRAYRGRIPFLSEHIERLNKSLVAIGLEPVVLEWEKVIKGLLSENKLDNAYIRITAYKKRKGIGTIIYLDEFKYYTADTYSQGFSSIIASEKRCIENLSSRVKSLSYLSNRLSWLEAQKKGASEALVLNNHGFLAGGSRSNLFLVKDKTVFTPQAVDAAFAGITRQSVIGIAKGLGLKLNEQRLRLDDLFRADEAFLSSTLLQVMPLVSCEGKNLGPGLPGPITLDILSGYREKVGSENQ